MASGVYFHVEEVSMSVETISTAVGYSDKAITQMMSQSTSTVRRRRAAVRVKRPDDDKRRESHFQEKYAKRIEMSVCRKKKGEVHFPVSARRRTPEAP